MSKNPCYGCSHAYHPYTRSMPSKSIWCNGCIDRIYHQEWLKAQRKYTEGETISSLDELMQQEYIMLRGTPKHIKVIQSMTLRTVQGFLVRGAIRKALVKGEPNTEGDVDDG